MSLDLESEESDKEFFFGPYTTALNMHKYAIDNNDSSLNLADVTNGFIMELATNCLKYVDCVYVLARLVKEDILQDEKKRLDSIVSKVRTMYNQTKAAVKKNKQKQKKLKEYLDEPFQLPAFKGSTGESGTPSSSRSNTPSNQARIHNGQASNSSSNNPRRDSVESSLASIEEGNCWDPNADEQGNDGYFMQLDEEERPASSGTYDLQQHLAKIQVILYE